MSTINQQWAKLIEATKDPTAPLKLQAAYSAVNVLGQLLGGGVANQDVVSTYSNALMSYWSEDEIEAVCNKPDFAMALCGMLLTSIKAWKDSL